ncbi:MAG: glycosyltransferase family 2 protein, partial [Scardovia wiggsiae]|nr:glycosyltransferase family 2 protein [Scardovia wiggsiae]
IQSRLLNAGRSILGNNGWIGGTGFMFSKKVMERNAGWKFHLLTEDVEFTMDCILSGDHIGYCSTAVFYDEQPASFKQSWNQRVRWSKGFLQVFRYYGLSMIRWSIRERDLSAMDLTLIICPFMVISLIRFALSILYAALGYVSWESQLANFSTYWVSLVGTVVGFTVLAVFICILERKKINATNRELVAYCLSFPWFMLSYVPISFVAIFSKSQWKPITHKGTGAAGKEDK